MSVKEYDEATLKKVQSLELEILKDFIEVCEKNNLKYFGIGGTAIGVIRHQGFIPWDDDIDVALPRDDYEKLVSIMKRDYGDKYIVLNAEENPKFPLTTTHLILKGTKFRTYAMRNVDCEFGIFLDVFAYDKVSDNPKERKKQLWMSWFFSKLLILRCIPFPVLGFNGFLKKIIHFICLCVWLFLNIFHISKPWLYNQYIKYATKYNDLPETELINYMGDTNPYYSIYKTSDVFPLAKREFEGLQMCFPNNMHDNLTNMFGDYMQLPPEDKRKNHFPYELDFGEY